VLEVVCDGKNRAFHHMEIDRTILREGSACPRLRFYEWDSFCCTAGLFVKVDEFVNESILEIATRPTGGGILFHENDLCFSLFIPSSYALYTVSLEELSATLNGGVLEGLRPFLAHILKTEKRASLRERFCMGDAHMLDLVWNGKKIGGCAFRRSKRGVLCQTSLFAGEIPWEKMQKCVKKEHLVDYMKGLCEVVSITHENAKKVIQKAMEEVFR
jgi:lipoate---protein ligase